MGKASRRKRLRVKPVHSTTGEKIKPIHTIHRERRTIVIQCKGKTVAAQDFPGDLQDDFFKNGKEWIKETLDAHKEVCQEK